jgi:hypothetical protein
MTKYTISHDKLTLERDKQKVIIRRVKRGNLKNFLEKHEELLKNIVENNFAWGEILENEIAYQDFVDFCKLIPVDNSEEGFDFRLIEDDYEFLNLFFVSTSWNSEKDEFENIENREAFKYSLISKLMGIDNAQRLGKIYIDHMTERQTVAIQEEKTRLEALKKAGLNV